MEVIPQYFADFAAEMRAFVKKVDVRFDRVDEKLDVIAITVQHHDEVISRLEPLVGDHEGRISRLERSMTRMRLKFDN